MIGFFRRFYRAWNSARSTGGKLRCSECGCRIHRFEKFEITGAKHRDCSDPKQVGQQSMKAREDA